MTIYRKLFVALPAILLMLCSVWAHSDSVKLVLNPIPSGPPGSNLQFDGTLTNLTSATVYLVTPNLLDTGGLTPDYSPFTSMAPLALAPNASTGSILLFTAVIDPNTPIGTQIDSEFFITGGMTPTSTDVVAQEFFPVEVTASNVPEPASLVSLLAGFGLMCLSGGLKSTRAQGRHRTNRRGI